MKIGIHLQKLFQPILGRVLSVARKILERPFLQLQNHFCHWSQHQKRRRNLHISCSLPYIHEFFWEWTCCSLKIFRLALVRQKCMTLQIWKETRNFRNHRKNANFEKLDRLKSKGNQGTYINYNFFDLNGRVWLDNLSRAIFHNYNLTNIKFGAAKGQLISKCPFGVFKSPKKPMKFLSGLICPSLKSKNKGTL